MPVMHKLVKQGGFAGRIGEAAMLADETNLEILNEVYVKDELDFVNQAIAKVKEALCLLPIPEEMQ